MGYGADEWYTRWSRHSLEMWKELAASSGERLFEPAGVLWMARGQDPLTVSSTLETLARLGVRHETARRARSSSAGGPQIDFGPVAWGIYEPDSGALMARRGGSGGGRGGGARGRGRDRRRGGPAARRPRGGSRSSRSDDGRACPPTRSSSPADPGCRRCFRTCSAIGSFRRARRSSTSARPPETRGSRRRRCRSGWTSPRRSTACRPRERAASRSRPTGTGRPFDPDSGERRVTAAGVAAAREFVARRFPALRDAPLVASEVCQYENTSNGDFLIDRHPDRDERLARGRRLGPRLQARTGRRRVRGGAHRGRQGRRAAALARLQAARSEPNGVLSRGLRPASVSRRGLFVMCFVLGCDAFLLGLISSFVLGCDILSVRLLPSLDVNRSLRLASPVLGSMVVSARTRPVWWSCRSDMTDAPFVSRVQGTSMGDDPSGFCRHIT